MKTRDLENYIKELILNDMENEDVIQSAYTYKESGYMDYDVGVVIKDAAGHTFAVTITEI